MIDRAVYDVTPTRAYATAETIVDVQDIVKSFPAKRSVGSLLKGERRGRVTVLRGITLSIGRGELFGLLGPNGAGKTTLLKMLTTLLLPDSGRIVIDGVDVVRDPLAAKRLIGLCPSEERSFYFRLTARANMEYFGALVGLPRSVLRKRIEEVAEIVGLSCALDKKFITYSSGMRQRLTVARALLADPPVMIFDEPTKAVDPVNAEAIRELIRDELVGRQGKTAILATNLLNEAWDLCDRIAVVNGGQIVALDTPEALTAEFRTVAEYQLRLGGFAESVLTRIRAIQGVRITATRLIHGECEVSLEVQPTGDSLRRLMSVLGMADVQLKDFRSIEPEPVHVFRHVTRDAEHR